MPRFLGGRSRSNAGRISSSTGKATLRRRVLFFNYNVDPPESRGRRAGGIFAKSLLDHGHDRDRATTVEMLQERVEKTSTIEGRRLPIIANVETHWRSSRAHWTHIDWILQFSKNHGYREQWVETETINLCENVSHHSFTPVIDGIPCCMLIDADKWTTIILWERVWFVRLSK